MLRPLDCTYNDDKQDGDLGIFEQNIPGFMETLRQVVKTGSGDFNIHSWLLTTAALTLFVTNPARHMPGEANRMYVPVQIILRRYPDLGHMLRGFDLSCCMLGYGYGLDGAMDSQALVLGNTLGTIYKLKGNQLAGDSHMHQ